MVESSVFGDDSHDMDAEHSDPSLPQAGPEYRVVRALHLLWVERPAAWALALFFAAFLGGAGISQWLAVVPGTGISVWPSGGILLAALLLSGRRQWSWWLLMAVAAELAANLVWFHNSLALAVLISAGNCTAGVVGASLIRRFTDQQPFRLENLRDVIAFVVFGGIVGTATGASISAVSLALLKGADFRQSWLLFWTGDTSGSLIVAPLVIVAMTTWTGRTRIPPARFLEATAVLALLVGIVAVIFTRNVPLVYPVLLPLLWAAIRFHFKGAAVALAVLAGMTLAFTVRGTGSFVVDAVSVQESWLLLQVFLSISCVLTLIVAAIARHNHLMMDRVSASNAWLERSVHERTAELQASEARFRQMADAMAQIVWIARGDGTIEYLNQRWFEYAGVAQDVELPAGLNDFIHPLDEGEVARRWERSLSDGEAFQAEFRLRGADGSYRWFLGRAVPISNAKSEASRWFGTSTDVDDLRGLKLENERLVQLVSNSNDFIGITDRDLGVQYVNPAGLALLGIDSLAAAQKLSALDMIYPDDLALISPEFLAQVERSGSGSLEFRLRHQLTGAPIWIDYRAFPVRDASGTVNGFATISQVAEARRAAEALRQQLIDDLSLADQRKDEFLATLAHELRNPLAPIVTATELLQTGTPDGERIARATAMLKRQVAQITRLVDDLLDVSRINLGKISIDREIVQIADLLEVAVETAQSEVRARRQRLDLQVAGDLPAIRGDRVRLTQVFSNLINNASKFSEPEGRVQIRAVASEGSVVVSVRDEGIGIDAEDARKLFRMFGQIRDSRRNNVGLGIGLSLARALVEMHGGTITVTSPGPGHGSTFSVTLPAISAADADVPPDAGTAAGLPTVAPGSVLIVDDNEDAAISLAMLLESHGYAVGTAPGGREALEATSRSRFEVVVLDIGMPELSGYEVARRIRDRDGADCPKLIALTGWGQRADRERSARAGFDAHLLKPASVQALIQAINDINDA